MASVRNDQSPVFPWATFGDLRTTFPAGVVAGIGIHGMDRGYFKYVDSTKYFQGAQPQELVKKALQAPHFSPLLRFRVVCINPVLEEVVFRGLMRQSQLSAEESVAEKAQRITINSGFFTAIHYNFSHSIRANARLAPPLFAAGVIFNGMMDATESIFAPILGHSLSNLFVFKYIKR